MTAKHQSIEDKEKIIFDPKNFLVEKKVIRTNLLFQWHKKKSPTDAHKFMTDLFGEGVCSIKTVYNWFEKFNQGDFSLEDHMHPGKSIDVEKAETICKMVEEDPFISVHEISRRTDLPRTTVGRYLFQYGGYISIGTKIVPYILNEEKKEDRIKYSQQIHKILKKKEKEGYIGVLTGDETWIYQSTYPKRVLVKEGEEIPAFPKEDFREEKMMIAVFISSNDFHVLHMVPEGATLKHHEYLKDVIKPTIEDAKKKFGDHQLYLHHDNSSVHKTADIIEYLKEKEVILIPQPPYSPDLSPLDFYLWGRLKTSMMGLSFSSKEKQLEHISKFLNEISHHEFLRVFDHWVHRLEWVMDNDGDYYLE